MPQLDHIVIRLSEAATEQDLLREAESFKKYFSLSPGGFHTGGGSQNVLVSLDDGVYIELIAFTSAPPTDHRWAQRKPPSIVDFAFLGHPEGGKEYYEQSQSGGRGECKWTVTVPKKEWGVGVIPFWCEDITPRDLRVPNPPKHPSGVTAISNITILVDSVEEQDRLIQMYRQVLGGEDLKVGTPSGGDVILDIRVAETQEEFDSFEKNGRGIYKVNTDVPGVTLSNGHL
jgi:hypothetical protein